MGRGKVFECEVTVSSGVKEKVQTKHHIEIWEVEEVIYDDLHAFSIRYKDCHFIHGQTFFWKISSCFGEGSFFKGNLETWFYAGDQRPQDNYGTGYEFKAKKNL